jgi:hypothetical protein
MAVQATSGTTGHDYAAAGTTGQPATAASLPPARPCRQCSQHTAGRVHSTSTGYAFAVPIAGAPLCRECWLAWPVYMQVGRTWRHG